MKRTFVYLAALVGMAGAVYCAGAGRAQAPAGGTPPVGAGATPGAAAGRDVAVFNVAKVMKDFQKWQYYAKIMNDVRAEKTKQLGTMAEAVSKAKTALDQETIEAQRAMKEKQYKDLLRQYEDASAEVRRQIDDQSSKHLKELHDDIKVVVEAVASRNGFGVVFAFPDATTEEEKKSAMYHELKLRPPAAMPFYVAPNCDITEAVVQTLNKFRPAPPPIATTGGTAPAVPGPGTGAPPVPPAGTGRPGGL